MPEISEFERDIRLLETELRKLEREYNMFFAGRLPKPPSETRARVESIIRKYDRAHLSSYAERYRFQTLQWRYATFVDLWERGLRAKEEGRAGPFLKPAQPKENAGDSLMPVDRVVHVTTLADPIKEIRKVEELYDCLVEAGRATGEAPFPFHRFMQLVRSQVLKMQRGGSREVAFRVALRDGHVTFTARGLSDVDS